MIVSPDQIKRAGDILRQIEDLQSELATLFSGANAAAQAPKRRGRPPGSGAGKGMGKEIGKAKRKMSAAGRARIAAAAKARWAKFHAEKSKSDKK